MDDTVVLNGISLPRGTAELVIYLGVVTGGRLDFDEQALFLEKLQAWTASLEDRGLVEPLGKAEECEDFASHLRHLQTPRFDAIANWYDEQASEYREQQASERFWKVKQSALVE